MKVEVIEEKEYKAVLKKAANRINELNRQLEETKDKKEIAVIGYSCRFPGGANSTEEFWNLLLKGFDAVSEISEERFPINKYYQSEKNIPGKTYTKYAALLDGDIKSFDNVHFEISANEAVSIDPQHKLLLEVSWEAMENAGLDINRLKGSKTGVFIGAESFEYVSAELVTGDVNNITPYTLFGVMPTSAAGRLSYFYDFKGPAITCDTACSSSLMALNMAVESLRNGQCDMAVVGGVNLILGPESFIGLSQIQALSPDGRCKTFDASADGFGRGEGCGIVLLKRAADAKNHGDTIEALIRGIGVGQDGKSNGFFAPNGLAEQNVMSNALNAAGIRADDVDYIEAHGTGTTLGDSIETQAIREAYKNKNNKMLIGSVKSNLGHLEAAAGIASMIKVLLCIKHKQIPPSIHFINPNQNINWDKIKVVSEPTAWNKISGKRRAGISSYGISGTLAHVILEEPDRIEENQESDIMPCNILTLSAKSDSALRNAMKDMRELLISKDCQLQDVTYSSNIARSHLNHRIALVGSKKEELINALEEAQNNEEIYDFNTSKVKNRKNKIAFLFTGQGSVYADIAKQLYENSKEFRETFDLCEKSFADILGISIKKAIYKENESLLSNPLYSQPVIFSIEYALTKVWDTVGIKPEVVIGHSIGEYAAACYAGLISPEDAIKMIACRGRLMESVEADGKMAGILSSAETIEWAIAESGCKHVSVAAVNAPKNVTISGKKEEVDKVIDVLHKRERTFVNDLRILHPYHSVMMKQYETAYGEELSDITFLPLNVKMISGVTGKVEGENVLGTNTYWTEHLSSTVNYQAAVLEAKKLGINVFVEIGGNATLSGLAEQCIQQEEAVFVPSLRKGIEDYRQLLTSLKTLYLHGIELNWNKFYGTYKKEKVMLPGYPFQRKKLWKELNLRSTSTENNIVDVLRDDMGGINMIVKERTDKRTYTKILSEVIEIVHMITGMEREEIEPDKELFAFGFDSLLMASLGKQLMMKYNLELSLDKLFSSLNTLDKITMYISDNSDSLEPDTISDRNESGDSWNLLYDNKVTTAGKINEVVEAVNSDSNYSGDFDFIKKLFENQFEIMREQNSIFKSVTGIGLRGLQPVQISKTIPSGIPQQSELVRTEQPASVKTNYPISEKSETNKKINPNYYVPFKKLNLEESSDLENLQLKYLKNIEEKYTSLTKNSKMNTQKYRNVYASNRQSAGFRPIFKEMLYQITAQKGKGSKLIDIDGNELLDLTMGFGVNLFGHCPQFVKEALLNEINNGMPIGPMGRLPGEVARQISEITGVERVFFCNSGTEADMFAVRLARAVTGKNKVVCFRGAFHGTYDGLLGLPTFSQDPDNATVSLAPGITDNAVRDLILLEYNSEASLKYIEEHRDIIAAVLTEPVQSRRPDVQPKEFLHKLRKVTEQNNIALIFDEIITGFRVSLGGAQEYFGIQADIVTYGKIIGGGMPIGIVSGKSKYLDSVDGGMWSFGDDSVPPCDDKRTFVAGTFCHHPLAMATADAVLKYLVENKDTLYVELNNKTDRFVHRMNTFFNDEKVPLHIDNFGSLFRFNITLDREIFYYGLIEKGIYVWEGRNCFFSTEHTEEDIENIVTAIKSTVYEMKEAGYFGNFNKPTDPHPGHGWEKIENSSKELPMSIIQQRLYSHMLMTESDPYDIVSAYLVKEKLNVRKIEDAVNKIIKRHEILRTVLYLNEGEYIQRIQEEWNFKVKEIEQTQEVEMNETIARSISRFDLTKAPLLEIILITRPFDKQIIIFHFHHMVSDGISMDLFVGEFSKLYKNLELPPLKKQYKDYVAWEQEYLNSDKLEKDGEYWVNNLTDIPKVTAIPYDYKKTENSNYPGNTRMEVIDKATVSTLKKIARNNSASIYMVLLSAITILLHKTTGENEIAVSTPATNRFDGGFEDCIGMFTNTILLKNVISTDENFEELLSHVKRDCLQAYGHMNYPYNQLIKQLNLIGEHAFSTEFVYENIGGRTSNQSGLELEDVPYIPSTQESDITFELLECDGAIDVYLRYRADLFKEESIKRLLSRFLFVIDQIAAAPRMNISDIEIITKSEIDQILGKFNQVSANYPMNMTMVELFEAQVMKTPYNIALVYEGEQLTYAYLNEKVNMLANRLRKLGVKPDDFVAIIAERSIEMVVAIYGVMKAGGAYVPIIPSYPADRIEYMLKDCEPKAVLTYKTIVITELSVPVIDLEAPEVWTGNPENPVIVNSPKDVLYLIYTSGTTGKPKGVMVEHRNVISLLKNDEFQFDFDENDVWMMFHSYCFDFSVWEMYGATLNGGTLVLISGETAKDSGAVLKVIQQNKVTVLNQVPSAFYNLMNSDSGNQMDSVRYLIFGGEALKPSKLYQWHERYKHAKIINMYGITETTVHVTYKEIGDDEIARGISDIGKAIPTLQVYLMNGNTMCGIGVPGELCVTGDGVARGYLNNARLTDEKFVDNPYGSGKMYRSGDLARWMSDGNLEYLGRMDEQVKVRGFRIELGEIENHLRKIEAVRDAAVILRKDESQDAAIYAYVVSEEPVNFTKIRAELEKSLPDYMIPSYMMRIERIPITRNGKLDKNMLPVIEAKVENEYLAPGNEIEEKLCSIFEKILGVETVGINDSFFELGGHSLRATRLVNLIEADTGYKVALKEVFNNPTVGKLGVLITGKEAAEYSKIPIAEQKDYYPMSSTQKRTYLIGQMNSSGIAYNMPGSLELIGDVQPDAMKAALQQMINRHEILRTEFLMVDGEPVQRIRKNVEADYEYVIDYTTGESELMDSFVRPFDLSHAPLVRIKLVQRADCHLLMIDTHHIISDGMSIETFTREMTALYNGVKLEPLTCQYKDYSEWMRARDMSAQKEYWVTKFSDEIPILDMPLDYSRPQEQSYRGAFVNTAIGAELGRKIKELANKTETTEYMIFLSAVMVLLSKYSRQEDIVIGSPISARTHKDTEGMLGMFVNTLAMRGKPEDKKSYQEFLTEIKANCMKAYENQEYPFEDLVEAVDVRRDMSRNPLFDVLLALQNNEKEEIKFSGLSTKFTEYKSNIAKFDLTFDIKEEEDYGFSIILEYCRDLYKEETVKRMLIHFVAILEQLISNPDIRLSEVEAITGEEKIQILRTFNNTGTVYPRDKTVVELFEEQVLKTPDHIAVVFENKQLTYSELNAKANSLALKLRDMGVRPDDFVAVIAHKSVEMIIGVCGILKSGAAYVPIDEAYPKDRIKYILNDCKPKVLLVYNNNIDAEVSTIDLASCDALNGISKNPPPVNKVSDLSYVIYTSGTTGKPKGVMIEHKSIVKLVKNCDYTELNEETIILQTGQLAFDASTFELWGCFLNGGKLHLLQDSVLLDGELFKKYIIENKINTMFITTALFNQMIGYDDTVFDTLKHLMFGGEATSEIHLRMLRNKNLELDFRNVYGPTETTTFATHYKIEDGVTKTPIGRPVSNTQIYIISKNKICGIGVPGELCILGEGLARGYLNNSELTDEKFVDNPFGEGKMYRSGDLARWLLDGNLEYLGRIDEQVKIRGFRIELEEVESAIRAIDYVMDCSVIVRSILSGDKAICAYIVAEKNLNLSEIREKLGLTIPQYMIPAYMMQIDSIPVNRSGKVDKTALPAIEIKTESEYIAPGNDREVVLCKAFEEVLGVEKIGTKDSFFELGGDSLKAIRVISKVRDYGYSVTVQNIMQYQIVSAIAPMLHSFDQSMIMGDAEAPLFGEVPLGAIQKLFIKSEVFNPNHFNMSVMFESAERISEEAMHLALTAVVQHHDMLRVVLKDGKQRIKKPEEGHLFELKKYDLRESVDKEQITEKIQAYMLESQETIHLKLSPLMSVTVFSLKDSDHIHICLNHFVVDAISMRIITEDIFTAYYYSSNQEAIRLPKKTASFGEWVLRLTDYENGQKSKLYDEYWENRNEQVGTMELPVPNNKKKRETANYQDRVKLSGFSTLANKVLGTNMNNLITAAVAKAVGDRYGLDKIAINMEGHGRYDFIEDIFVDRTVGWFTGIYPLIFQVGEDFNATLQYMLRELKSVPDSGLGYLPAMDKIDAADINIPPITVNYLGSINSGSHTMHNIKISEFSYGQDMDKRNLFLSPLSVNVTMENDEFEFNLVYDQSIWYSDVMKEIFNGIGKILKEELNGNNNTLNFIPDRTAEDQQLIQSAKEEMERYEHEIISAAEFTDYPLTGIQRVSYEIKSRNAVIDLPFFDKIDLGKFSKSWMQLHRVFDVLRSSISMNNNSEFIRIYHLTDTKIPYVDISLVNGSRCNELIEKLLDGMNCFELDEMYEADKLSSKVLLVKVTDTAYRLLFSCSHLIFDRFSSEVLKNKLMDIYYGNTPYTGEYSYKNYYGLLRNERISISEEEIIKRLDLERFYKAFQHFYGKNETRKFENYNYVYANRDEWTKLTEKEMLTFSHQIFIKAMQFIFPGMDIPLLTLHISRKNNQINLFDYIGEFLDVIPLCIAQEGDCSIEDEIEDKLSFVQENNLYFSSLFYADGQNGFRKIKKMLSEIHDRTKLLLVYNNTGILKSSNNLIVNSEKYRIFYNVMSVVVNNDGLFMNVPIDSKLSGKIKDYLDSVITEGLKNY